MISRSGLVLRKHLAHTPEALNVYRDQNDPDNTKAKYEFHDTEIGPHFERALHAVAMDEHRKEFDVTPMTKLATSILQM